VDELKHERAKLWIGGEAVAEAAIRYGVRFAAAYPISPGEKTLEYFATELPRRNGVFIHAEGELQAINYLYGAAAGGVRCATNSSSLGFSLMMEGISYMVQRQLPALLINHSRGYVGNDGIGPSQADYFQMTKSGPHGGARMPVLAPSTLQETIDLVNLGLHLGDKYRTPVVILGDVVLAQCSELVTFPPMIDEPLPPKDWAVGNGRPKMKGYDFSGGPISDPSGQGLAASEQRYRQLQEKWNRIAAEETRVELVQMEDAEYAIVAFGTCGRICKTVVQRARAEGIRVGLIRPVTVWPFPSAAVAQAAEQVKGMLVVEMNLGQMLEDVELAVKGRVPVRFFGRQAGVLPTPAEIMDALNQLVGARVEVPV
jgi:2-oxoglutarate/2-oxoacid ferredoxin oxidoreductase subunit alpha